MNVQTIEQTNGQTGPASSTDSFVDAALDALTDTGPANDNVTRPKPPKQPRPEEPAPEGDEPEESPEEPLAPEPDGEEEEHQEPEGESAEEPHDTRGSREEPFTVKDLPEDKFIELKVDGEKTVVPLAELAKGYIREQTFNQRINKTKSLADEAQSAVESAKEMKTRLRDEFKTFVSDPETLYDFFLATEEREGVLEQVAMKYASLLKRFRENPNERLAFQRRRDVERLQAEREHFERQRREAETARQQKEANEQAVRIFKPGWEEGLRKAGFPQPTPDLYQEVLIRCRQRAESGQPVTSDDVAEFTLRACKLLELQPKGAKKPKPAPAPVTKPAERRRSADPWAGKSASERKRDPEYFLRNLRSRDFR